MKIRIPGWVKGQVVPTNLYSYSDGKRLGFSITINGKEIGNAKLTEDGYFTIDRKWKKGDVVKVHFDMEARTVRANNNVEADRGMVEVERGPLVYCAEWPDNKFDIKTVILNQEPKFTLGTMAVSYTHLDGDDNVHMHDVNEVADATISAHPEYLVRKIMWDAYPQETSASGHGYPAVTNLIKRLQSSGALIFDYGGHGRPDQVSHENVLRLTDFKAFSNKNLPLWVTATCDIMPYDGVEPTIGETAVLNENGGAMAFFGTARTVFVPQNKAINRAFMTVSYTHLDVYKRQHQL